MPRPSLFIAILSCILLLAAPAAAQPVPTADLAVQKDAYDVEVFGGEEAVFFIAVTNEGPDTATGVTVDDVLPEGLVFTAAHASCGSYDPDTGAWAIGALAEGQTELLELTVVLSSEEPVQNCASVGASDQRDPNAANDTDCAYVYVRPKREKMVPLALHTPDTLPATALLR